MPDHLEDIVAGSHPSLGEAGRLLLRSLLHRYEHVFPTPGEPVTGHTTSVQHEILTSDARPVRCGPRRLAPAGLHTEHTCVKEMLLGGHIEPSDSPWASPVVLVTKKDGSTRFCVDYRRFNSLTIKDAYPLPRIDDSVRLLGNQQWFSTMDLASGSWKVAMSPEAKRKAAFVVNEGLFQFLVMPVPKTAKRRRGAFRKKGALPGQLLRKYSVISRAPKALAKTIRINFGVCVVFFGREGGGHPLGNTTRPPSGTRTHDLMNTSLTL